MRIIGLIGGMPREGAPVLLFDSTRRDVRGAARSAPAEDDTDTPLPAPASG